jgi:hypothetical protein
MLFNGGGTVINEEDRMTVNNNPVRNDLTFMASPSLGSPRDSSLSRILMKAS